ncbi:MAG: dihydrofolate reductase [Gemmatimonas sp.]|nr:dihydrofolate reductase [Gemmatimonas sp.]
MAESSRTRVFVGCSLDGFIAGPNDELDWLPNLDTGEDTFTPFLAAIGAMAMGRRTFDIVEGFEGDWLYGALPILVATHRPLSTDRPTVSAVSGPIQKVIAEAKRVAGAKDVYVDGGILIREALDAGLVDEITVTIVPKILGRGIPLFAGAEKLHGLDLQEVREIGGGMVHVRYSVDDREAGEVGSGG